MTEEVKEQTSEAPEKQEELELPQNLDLEQSFNLLVNLARQSKLTYDEHERVDKAVRAVSQELNLQG